MSQNNNHSEQDPDVRSDKYWRIITAVLLLVLMMTGAWAYGQHRAYRQAQNFLEGDRQRAFYSLLSSIEELEIELGKAQAAGSPAQLVEKLTLAHQRSDEAASELGNIPMSHTTLINTGAFLTQMGDYCFSLMRSVVQGRMLTAQEREQIADLHVHVSELGQSLHQLRERLQEEGYRWSRMQAAQLNVGGPNPEDPGFEHLQQIDEDMQEVPSLIYDGPFSDHVLEAEPEGLTGAEIEEERARALARDIMQAVDDETDFAFEKVGEARGDFASYTFMAESERDTYWLDISKKGGHLMWLNSEPIDAEQQQAQAEVAGRRGISVKEAKEIAESFVRETGYSNMQAHSAFVEGERIVTNLVLNQDDVMIYPDQVKVMVSSDNGSILAMDATPFLETNKPRSLPEPSMDMQEAKNQINPMLSLAERLEPQLALIERDDLSEVLCWEISAQLGDNEFLVYINVLTGTEEDILQLIEVEGGYLTE